MGPLLQPVLWKVESTLALHGCQTTRIRAGEERRMVLRYEHLGREDGQLRSPTGELAVSERATMGHPGAGEGQLNQSGNRKVRKKTLVRRITSIHIYR
mmetsp:Transcript_38049/g.56608  ORF Transcript_38049/g.56608 Transcript_38049/m.56608 type:complete len:98 (+) Transcript_38049:1249-1542(+)